MANLGLSRINNVGDGEEWGMEEGRRRREQRGGRGKEI